MICKEKANENKEVMISKISTIFLGIIAIFLGILFEGQNVAFMVGMAFAIAASANFPVLFLSIYWRKLTTKGAFYGGFIGLITAIILVIIGPVIWVDIFNFEKPIFPYKYPALFSVVVSFFSIYIISITDSKKNIAQQNKLFEKQFYKSYLGQRK